MQPTHTNTNTPYGTTPGTYNTTYPAGATAPNTTTTYPTGHTAGHTTGATGEKPSMMEKAKQAVGMGRHGSGSSSSSSDSDNEAKHRAGHHTTPAVGTHGIAQPGGATYNNPVSQHATFANTGTPTGTGTHPTHESLVDKAKHTVGMDKHHTPANAGYTSTAPGGVHQTHGTGYSYAGAPQHETMADKAKHAVGMGTPHHTESHPATYGTTGTVNPINYGTTGTQQTAYGSHATAGYPTTGTHGTTGTHTTSAYDTTGTHTTGYGNTATGTGTGTAEHKPTMMEKVKGKVEQVVDTAKGAVGGNKHKNV